jgi:hypothetical protein
MVETSGGAARENARESDLLIARHRVLVRRSVAGGSRTSSSRSSAFWAAFVRTELLFAHHVDGV